MITFVLWGSMTIDALDLAVPKERLTHKITQETEFKSSSWESLMTSSVEVDSESDLTYLMDSSSKDLFG